MPHSIAVWILCSVAILGVLVRPRGTPEWVWAAGGAAALTVFGLVAWRDAAAAVAQGADVYLFLTGMMLLAELARREGVFDWVAGHAATAARGSRLRLFALVYGAGVAVTIVLSNDATAVVLTPAVAAVVRRARVEARPYLFACAFVANAASFVLPISNPANLVVFGSAMPALPRWLAAFALPSFVSIVVTFVALALLSRRALAGAFAEAGTAPALTTNGRIALGGIAVSAIALVAASAFALPLGATTCVCGCAVVALATARDRSIAGDVARSVTWSVLVLVAGLFVLVRGLDTTGLLDAARSGAAALASLPPPLAGLSAGAIAAAASNIANNLPAGLVAGSSLGALRGHDALRAAVAIGIDLGPNLSVTGSLATVLWLTALRREGIAITSWSFLRAGAIVMPPALFLAILATSIAR